MLRRPFTWRIDDGAQIAPETGVSAAARFDHASKNGDGEMGTVSLERDVKSGIERGATKAHLSMRPL